MIALCWFTNYFKKVNEVKYDFREYCKNVKNKVTVILERVFKDILKNSATRILNAIISYTINFKWGNGVKDGIREY